MRNLLLICVLLPQLIFSQSDKEVAETNLKYYNEVFGEYEKQFDVFEAPEKFKDESLVVLCQKVHLSFQRYSDNGYNGTKGITRKRILIQDKSELNTLTEFYFQPSEAIGIRLIKPDGTTKKIDTDNAKKVESKVPDLYTDNYHHDQYYKIAIPNLEVGDIIDFFKVFTQEYTGIIEVISSLEYSYPVVSQEIVFDVEKSWQFYYDTFNGAPAIKEDPNGGIDNSGRKKKIVKRYVMQDKERATKKYESYSYPNLTDPLIKFMAIPTSFGYKSDEKIQKGLDLETAIKNNIGKFPDYAETINERCYRYGRSEKFFKLPKEQRVNKIYNALRYYYVEAMMKGERAQRMSYEAGAVIEMSHEFYKLSRFGFTNIFANALKDFDIDAEYAAVVPKHYGNPDQVVVDSEITYGVYVPLTDTYYWSVDNYSLPGEEYKIVQGAVGYRIPRKKSVKKEDFKKIEIPYSTADNNTSLTVKEINIDEKHNLEIAEVVSFSGMYKSIYNRMLLFHTPYGKKDAMKYGDIYLQRNTKAFEQEGFDDYRLGGMGENLVSKFNDRIETYADSKIKTIQSWVAKEYNADTVTNYKVLQYGTTSEEPVLKASYNFVTSEHIKKAGPNLIFNIGELIGKQLELEEDQLTERTKEIFFNFPKTIENRVTINLPEGMTAHGLESINVNIDNPNASFSSVATQNGNKLTIETKKVYKKANAPASEWTNYTEMIEKAYDFSQQKIILKKT